MDRVPPFLVCATLLVAASCTRPPVVVSPDAGTDDAGDAGRDARVPLPDAAPGVDSGITEDPCRPAGGDVPIGGACETSTDCDDGCFCNGAETCTGGVCLPGDDPCAAMTTQVCATTACLEEVNRCYLHPHDERCADGDACNGRETCDPMLGCQPAELRSCSDENPCTIDACDPAVGCTYTPRDLDGDGYTDGHCGGNDCDDLPPDGAAIHPDRDEVCDNGRDDNCDGLRDYDDPTCIPTNDLCATARALPGRGSYSGATRMLHADYPLSCGTAAAADAVFTFDVADTSDLRVAFAGAGGGAIALRNLADCPTGPDLRCNAGTMVPTALVRGAPAGHYAAIVKTATMDAFTLSLAIDPPSMVLPGEDCGHPVIVSPDGTAGTIDTSMLGLDYAPSCGGTSSGYRDAVFVFATGTPRDVTLNVTTPGTYGDVVALDGDPCGTTIAEARCRSLTRATDTEFFRSLPAGSHYVIVSSRTSGTATLSVTTAAPTPVPPNDRCSGATVLTPPFGTLAAQTLIGFAPDMPSPSCLFASGQPDAFYAFHVVGPRPGSITVILSEPSGSTTSAYMDVRSACGGPEVAGTCASGTITGGHEVTTMTASGLAPGSYVVQVVENTSFSPATDFTLQWILDTGAP